MHLPLNPDALTIESGCTYHWIQMHLPLNPDTLTIESRCTATLKAATHRLFTQASILAWIWCTSTDVTLTVHTCVTLDTLTLVLVDLSVHFGILMYFIFFLQSNILCNTLLHCIYIFNYNMYNVHICTCIQKFIFTFNQVMNNYILRGG
jgi:hypothetical protein